MEEVLKICAYSILRSPLINEILQQVTQLKLNNFHGTFVSGHLVTCPPKGQFCADNISIKEGGWDAQS